MSDEPEETAYYLRLVSMYMDLGTETVLNLFVYHSPGKDPETFLKSKEETLVKLKTDRILNKQECELLLDKTVDKQNVKYIIKSHMDIKSFDISLIITLSINLFTEQQLQPPRKGWDNPPRNSDKSIAADLLRLRTIRNIIVGHHANARLPKWRFDEEWKNVSEILLRIQQQISKGNETIVKEKIEAYRSQIHVSSLENKYDEKLKGWQEDVSKAQDQVEDLLKKLEGFDTYFKHKCDRYERYTKLLINGGRFVLLSFLEEHAKKQGKDIRSILDENKDTLNGGIADSKHLHILFPSEPTSQIDMSSWSVSLLAAVVLQLFNKSIDWPTKLAIKKINDAVKNYAESALLALDSDTFEDYSSDLKANLAIVSKNLDEDLADQYNKILVDSKRKIAETEFQTYMDELKTQGTQIKKMADIFEETLQKAKDCLRDMVTRGIQFKRNHDLELKMITLGKDKEKKILAEEILTEVWLEALDRATKTPDFADVKKEVEKILKEIKKSKSVENITVYTACIILQISCTSPSDMLNMISYFESTEFREALINISNELGYYFNTALSIYSVISIECLMGVQNCQSDLAQPEESDIRLPITVSSPAGMLKLRSLLNSEKIVNSTNAISDALSKYLDDTITVKVCTDMKVFSNIFDEEMSSSDSCSDTSSSENTLTSITQLQQFDESCESREQRSNKNINEVLTEDNTAGNPMVLSKLKVSVINPVPSLQQTIDDFKMNPLNEEAEERIQRDVEEELRKFEKRLKFVLIRKNLDTQDIMEETKQQQKGMRQVAEKADKHTSDQSEHIKVTQKKRADLEKQMTKNNDTKETQKDSMPLSEIFHKHYMEWDFVGRKIDFRHIEQAWSKNEMFGIFGIRSVGKSMFVREYLKLKRWPLTYVELQYIDCIESLHSKICALIGIEPIPTFTRTDRWIKQITSGYARVSKNGGFVIFFDNAEYVLESVFKDEFLLLLTELLKRCPKIKIFITSTTRMIQFNQFRYFTYELHPLVPSEAKELLQKVAPDVDFGEYGDVIVKLSEGLPLLIMMVGDELEDGYGILSPADMVGLLCNCRLETLCNEFYQNNESVGGVYRNFLLRLSGEFPSQLTELDYVPGSFDAQSMSDDLDIETEAIAKETALLHIRRKRMLHYRRFNMQGILREVLKTNFAIRYLPALRKSYCMVFTDVLKKISEKMGTEEYIRTLAELAVEQPNLQKLPWKVLYTREDTYHFFIEFVSSYTYVVETFMPRESDAFYDACLRLTEMYKRSRDKADVYIAVGNMASSIKGDYLTGANNYQSALQVLESMESMDKSIQLATAYQRMGWNLLQQGLDAEAIQYSKKSLDISVNGGHQFECLMLQSFNIIGISLTNLGNFERAERYHMACLNRRMDLLGNDHPLVGATVNNIGILMAQKGDSAKALEYHLKALEIKRKSTAPETSLIYSINNTADAYSALGRYKDAHALLNEAEILIREQKMPRKDAKALIYYTRGKVLEKAGDLNDAEQAFAMTVKLRKEVSMEGFQLMKGIVSLARVQERQMDYDGCLQTIKDARKLIDESIKNLPYNTITVECLECLAKVYKGTDDRLNYLQTLYEIETECLRLERVCRQQNLLQKLENINETLSDIGQEIKQLSCTDHSSRE